MQATPYMMDAQAALGFVAHQRSHIESEILKREYPQISYSQLIPVDTSASDYAPSVTFFSSDRVGEAKFINGKGNDIPLVNMTEGKFEQSVFTGGIGYEFSLEEIGAAQQLGRNLSSEGAEAAAETAEMLIDTMALTGDAQLGTEGLFNTTGITSIAAGGLFSALTPDQILAEINGAIGAIAQGTKGVDLPNTLVIPISVFADIASRRVTDIGLTVLEFLRRSNAYTATTGQPLDIRGSHHLSTSAVIYRRDPKVLKLHMPMPLTFIPPQSVGLSITVHGMLRVAPPSIRRPGAFRYITGIAA